QLCLELLAPGARHAIETGAAVIFRGPPVRSNRTLLFQFEQQRIQGSLIERELISADLLDPPSDAVTVQGTQNIESLQDHECESALLDVFLLCSHDLLVSNRECNTVL